MPPVAATGRPPGLRVRRQRRTRRERQAANGTVAIAQRRTRDTVRGGPLEADADGRPTARKRRAAQRPRQGFVGPPRRALRRIERALFRFLHAARGLAELARE